MIQRGGLQRFIDRLYAGCRFFSIYSKTCVIFFVFCVVSLEISRLKVDITMRNEAEEVVRLAAAAAAEVEAITAKREATVAAKAAANEKANCVSTGTPLKSGNGDPKLLAFLVSIGQEHALQQFVKEDVDFATLALCGNEAELSDFLCSLGLTMGAQKKISKAFCSVSAAAKSLEIDQHNTQVEEGAKHQERLELALSEHRNEVARLRDARQRGSIPREFECPIRCARVTCFNAIRCDEPS